MRGSSPCPLAVAPVLPWTGCSGEDMATLSALTCSPTWWCFFSPAKPHSEGDPRSKGPQTHSLSHCPSQLTASNHVSNFTVNYNVTVEMMNRMKNLSVVGILPVLPQNSSVDLSARVYVDSAVEALFL